MTSGSLTLAFLMLTVNAVEPADTVFMNSGKFAIPITIAPERRGEISALELHMTRDRGQSWELYARATPEKENFQITTPGDGSFWFSVVVVDAQGRRDPLDLKTVPVNRMQRVFVDTARPEIKLTAERQGEEILVSWDIREDNLDPKTLRMEWMQANALPVVAPIVNETRGQTRIKPADPTLAVSIRMSATDLAGNQGMGAAEAAPGAQAPPGHIVSRESQPNIRPIDTRPAEVTPPQVGFSPIPPPGPGGMLPAPMPQTLATTAPGTARQTSAYATTGSVPPPQPEYPGRVNYTADLPPIQIVNKRQVKLEFDVAKYGPTGLGGVDVYVTMDDGKTWEKSPVDPNACVLPPTANGVGPLHASVTVPLNKEATVHGFFLIVKSRAGLGKPAPRPGDVPHLRVELDTTAPVAKLLVPEPDATQANTLIMRWDAVDAHMAANPITLEWAADKRGPWLVIGEPNMPNSGHFNWRLPADVPPSVYFRLTVRDLAGNTAVAETEKPELVDLTIPDIGPVKLQDIPR